MQAVVEYGSKESDDTVESFAVESELDLWRLLSSDEIRLVDASLDTTDVMLIDDINNNNKGNNDGINR